MVSRKKRTKQKDNFRCRFSVHIGGLGRAPAGLVPFHVRSIPISMSVVLLMDVSKFSEVTLDFWGVYPILSHRLRVHWSLVHRRTVQLRRETLFL